MEKLVIHRACLNIVEVIYCKSTSTININEEKLKAFPLKKKTRLYTLSKPVQYSTWNLRARGSLKMIKGEQVVKEEVKVSLYAEDTNAYRKEPKNSTGKLLQLINTLSKVAGHKVNTQKSVAFLYANGKWKERKMRETISFTIAQK